MFGLYLHIPYCLAKCHYCDFNSRPPEQGESFDPYVDALCRDIAGQPAGSIDTVFIGGGTPSILSARQVARIMDAVRRRFVLKEDAEVTMEANPGTVDAEKCRGFKAAGINRLSFGAQASQEHLLRILGRQHAWSEVIDAVHFARQAGFTRLNLDLMYGLPGQTHHDWEESLRAALALSPDHLSTYSLIVEEHTTFGTLAARGELTVPDEDEEDAMSDTTRQICEAAGLQAYEVSNWARPGQRCRHNMLYWNNDAYYGLGAGAVSYVNGWRWTRVKRPQSYIDRILAGQELAETAERVSNQVSFQETVSLAIRCFDGLHCRAVEARYGLPLDSIEPAMREEFKAEHQAGLVSFDRGHMRLSWQGMRMANAFIVRMMSYWAKDHVTQPDPLPVILNMSGRRP